jgi:hypothetical protein
MDYERLDSRELKTLGSLEDCMVSEYRNADPITATVIAFCCFSWSEMFLKGPEDVHPT